MADENLHQLQQEMDQFRNSLHGLGVATDNAGKNVDSFGQTMSKNLKGVSGSIGGLASSVQDGDQAFKQLNGVVNSVATALSGILIVGPAMGAGLKFLFEQVQTTAKAFNDMGQIGAITAKGMTGLRDQINASGMSVEGFKRNITENAGVLARWSTTVGAGTTDFSKALGALTTKDGAFVKAGDELRRLGFSADQIGETAGDFLKQQTLLGRQSTLTQAGLTQGTVEYGRELDQLSKLTGKSRKDIAKQQQAALLEGKYLAAQIKRSELGPAGVKAAAEIEKFQSQIAAIGPETAGFAKGIRDASSGNLSASKEARELNQASGGAFQDIMQRMTTEGLDSISAQKELQAALGTTRDAAIEYADSMGDTKTPYGLLAGSIAIQNAQMNKEGLVRKDLAASLEAAKKGTDPLTNELVKAQKNLESLSRQLFDIGTDMLPLTAKGIEYFTDKVAESVAYIRKIIGADKKEEEKTTGQTVNDGTVIGGAGGEGDAGSIMDSVKDNEPVEKPKEKDRGSDAARKARIAEWEAGEKSKKATLEGQTAARNKVLNRTPTTDVDSTVEIQKIEDERLKTIDGFKKRNGTLNKELAYNKNSLENIGETSKTNIEYREKLKTRNELIQKEIDDLEKQQREFNEAQEKRKTEEAKADLQKARMASPSGQKAGGTPGAPRGVGGAAGPQENIDTLLKFSGASGTKERFQQLDGSLQEAVVAAAKEYKSLSGGKLLEINSAKRDSADQKRLYDDWVAGGKKGKPVAQPGTSLHEMGFAVDIQNYNDPAAVKAMNNQGLSQRVANDPVHFSAAEGGVLSGPTSGFRATLHGTEAVVPLSGGRSIPVEMPGFTDKLSEQISMMAMQMSKLDILIETIRAGNKINKDILQVSRV